MKELLAAVGLAKTRVDAGFSRAGRRLRKEDAVDRVLMTLAARAISSANAVMTLCERGHANESLPLLRALAEWCVGLRWVAAEDSDARAKLVLRELESADWGDLWTAARLEERARAAGAWEAVAPCVGAAASFVRGNAAGLPWGHTYTDGAPAAWAPEKVLTHAARLLGHALKGLDARWPGDFPGAEEMWERVATEGHR